MRAGKAERALEAQRRFPSPLLLSAHGLATFRSGSFRRPSERDVERRQRDRERRERERRPKEEPKGWLGDPKDHR